MPRDLNAPGRPQVHRQGLREIPQPVGLVGTRALDYKYGRFFKM